MVLASACNLVTQWFPSKPVFTEADLPLQQGKVFIVTGGNTGIGYALIKILYGTGATIYMASRTKDKAEKAIKDIIEASPAPKAPGQLKYLQLDLADLASVKAAANTFAHQEPKLHVLFNNAGAGPGNTEVGAKTAQGLDPMLGTNLVGTLLFSTLLVPQLHAASTPTVPARVVYTSSFLAEGASPPNGVDFKYLDTGLTDTTKNYGMSKAGTWILCREFASRYGKDGIVSVIQNPGNLKSSSYDNLPALTLFFVAPLLHETIFGAYTEMYAGLSPDVTLENNGAYIIPWGRLRPDSACPRKDILNAMKTEKDGGLGYGVKLWDWCETKWKPFI